MTPSNMTAKRPTERQRRDDDLAVLIAACGRDERPALQTLYRRTAGTLYSLALAAADDRGAADRALVQTYLEVFGEAATFDADREPPITWLTARLARQLPGLAKLGRTTAVKPVEPPAELWQKLDIGLGLKRLDRHIKPGVATQPRGRDPMPNAYDRRIERQVRFWRSVGVAGCLAAVVAIGAILAIGLEGGPSGLLRGPSATGPQPAALQPTAGNPVAPAEPVTAAVPAATPAAASSLVPPATGVAEAAAWLAILQPASGRRLWRVRHTAGMLEVTAMPPFALADAAGKRVLVLWAAAGAGGTLRQLGTLDPAATTSLAMPAALDSATLGFVVSLEAIEPMPGEGPSGPLLFAGGRGP
jgi:hypothetical protein